jgi:hypothetical protein
MALIGGQFTELPRGRPGRRNPVVIEQPDAVIQLGGREPLIAGHGRRLWKTAEMLAMMMMGGRD